MTTPTISSIVTGQAKDVAVNTLDATFTMMDKALSKTNKRSIPSLDEQLKDL